MPDNHPSHLLWIDYETTGLWTADGPPLILEFAALLLPFGDFNLNNALVIADEVFPTTLRAMAEMDPVVLEMHTENGLLERCEELTAQTLIPPRLLMDQLRSDWARSADDAVDRIVRELGTKDFDVAAAGSGIASFDLPLMREWMPGLYNRLRYTPYDVSAFRRAAGMVWPDSVPAQPPWDECPVNVKHRAMPDVESEIWEAQWLRDNFWMNSHV